jgi:RNA polymerase sigma factor (TIGR02999 family)
LLYQELRQLAAAKLAKETPGQTLQPTALVHEAYARLAASRDQVWENRGHFFAAAAEAMRRILVDNARRKRSARAGGDCQRLDLDCVELPSEAADHDLLDLEEALTELERHDREAATLVKLRFFAGLTHADAAEALGISRGSADRLWKIARAWLQARLSEP